MLKEGYKKTELGEIPNEWNIVKTDEILINDKSSIKIGPFGSQLKKEFLIEQGYKVYGQENVFKNDFTLGNRYINKERYEILKSSELKSGDLVISMMGTVGKTAIVPEDIEIGIMDSHLIRLRVDESKYSKELLRQMIQNSPLIKKQIKKLSVGGIMEGLSSTIIKQLKFPLINLKEQEKIADILSTVDGQIDDTEMLIEKCQELKKGLMQRLLTKGIGHTEFKKTEVGEIPVEWEVKKLGAICNVKGGKRLPKGYQLIDEKTDNPYIRVADMYEGGIDLNNIKYVPCEAADKITNYKISKNDLFISVAGTLGIVGMIPKELDGANLTENADKLCDIKIDKEFLMRVLQSNSIQNIIESEKTTSAQPKLALARIREFFIQIPQKEEQEKISKILSAIDSEIKEYKYKKQGLEELKKGLMQQLLTGKIRTV